MIATETGIEIDLDAMALVIQIETVIGIVTGIDGTETEPETETETDTETDTERETDTEIGLIRRDVMASRM